MASGRINIVSTSTHDGYIDWTATPNDATNSSAVTAIVYLRQKAGVATSYGNGSFGCSIHGNANTRSAYYTVGSSYVELVRHTATIQHDANGDARIWIQATGGIPGTTLQLDSNQWAYVDLDHIDQGIVYIGNSAGTPVKGQVYIGGANGVPIKAKEIWIGNSAGTPVKAKA